MMDSTLNGDVLCQAFRLPAMPNIASVVDVSARVVFSEKQSTVAS